MSDRTRGQLTREGQELADGEGFGHLESDIVFALEASGDETTLRKLARGVESGKLTVVSSPGGSAEADEASAVLREYPNPASAFEDMYG